jgi:acyl carrier protein
MPEKVSQTDDCMISPTETVVGEIWAELLQLNKINPHDNFFEMGGDSLMIMMMLFRISDVLGVEIRPGIIMNAPTLREFCQAIEKIKSGILCASSDGEQSNVSNTESDRIAPCARKDNLPVSFIQEKVIGAELNGLYDPNKIRSHCLDLCYRIRGALDISSLDRALCEIVRRHEILRTGYSVADGTIFQNVNVAPQSILHVEDLRNLPQDVRERETERILKKIATDSFAYFRDRLMISATLITSETEHVLAVIINHVATDGVSMMILQNELIQLYQAFSHHAPSPLADLPIQYADFALWERKYFSGDRLEEKLAYWRKLSQESINTTLPVDHVPAVLSYTGDTVPVTILPELTTQLLQLGRKWSVTLFTVLFAAFISLVHVFSGYRYNFFCMPVANRSRGETRSLIGCFMNFQFVYIDLSGNPTFLQLVKRLNATLLNVYDNYVPFHFIRQQIPPQGPVVDFQLLTSMDEGVADAESQTVIRNANPGFGESSFIPFKLKQEAFALFPIDVILLGSSQTITGHFKYRTAAYDRNTIMDMVNDYMTLLIGMAHHPDARLHDMGIKPHKSVIQEHE